MANNDLIKKSAPGITFSSPEARAVYQRFLQLSLSISKIRGQRVPAYQLISELMQGWESDLSAYAKPESEFTSNIIEEVRLRFNESVQPENESK